MSWIVGDIVTMPAKRGGNRVWRVIGVFLGGDNQEDVIELETLDLQPCTQGRMCVPRDLLGSSLGARRIEK